MLALMFCGDLGTIIGDWLRGGGSTVGRLSPTGEAILILSLAIKRVKDQNDVMVNGISLGYLDNAIRHLFESEDE